MIVLGPLELEAVSPKAGDEGWTEHWQVFIRRGGRRRLLGYAVSVEGAIRVAAGHLAVTSRPALGVARAEWREWLRDLRRQTGLPDPARADVSGQETTSPLGGPGSQP